MLLFNEMLNDNKIKIYNKYAKYPKISEFDNKKIIKVAPIIESIDETNLCDKNLAMLYSR